MSSTDAEVASTEPSAPAVLSKPAPEEQPGMFFAHLLSFYVAESTSNVRLSFTKVFLKNVAILYIFCDNFQLAFFISVNI